MSIKEISVKINGISPLLMHNPQTVDRFNPYTKRMAQINAKKKNRTDEDYRELASIEMASSLYFDTNLGVYVPTRWILSAYAKHSFSIGKVSKANVRGSVFTLQDNVKLHYAQMDKVKESIDVVNNSFFRHQMALPQGGVRIMKTFPLFHDWSFECGLEYDDTMIDPDAMERIIKHAAKYGGFGDFRPTFGRAIAEVTHG